MEKVGLHINWEDLQSTGQKERSEHVTVALTRLPHQDTPSRACDETADRQAYIQLSIRRHLMGLKTTSKDGLNIRDHVQ